MLMRRFLSLFTMLMLCGVLAFAQNRVVSGKVTDANGGPVPFATVKIKGTPSGVAADANGVYSIQAKDGDILEISSTGNESQTLKVRGNENVINVQLTPSKQLSEIVVTALGIKRESKQLGYSTAKINTDELNQAKVTNVATGLAAKVSGLQVNLVNNSVKPDTRITLRGNRSILGNNQALLVVDDVQLPISYISSLNPNDVDNVTVLKGASASALYGSEASNGVIIVTTKRGGTKGKPVIRLSSTASFETISYLPEFQNEFGPWGGETPFASYPGQVQIPGFPYTFYAPYENQNYGPRFNGQRVPIGAPIRLYRADGSYVIAQDSTNYSAKPGAKKNFFDQGLTLINDLSYSAGDDKSKFYFSFQDVNTKGILPKDVSRRDGIRVNGSREAGIFRVDYNVGYTITHTNTSPGTGVPFTSTAGNGGGFAGGGSYFQNRPVFWTIINQPAMVDLRDYKNWQNDPYANPDGFFNAYYGNPWWQIDQTRLDEKNNDLLGSFSVSVKPVKWLDVLYRAGITRNDYSNKYTQAGYTFAPWAIADTLGSGNIPSSVKKLSPSQGDALSFNERFSSDLLATAHTAYKSFDFKFIAGTSLNDNKSRILSASANSLVIPEFYNISNRVGEPAVNENYIRTRRVGVFGDLTIGFKNFLFIHGSVRNDWNSILSEKNRSYTYPAADLSFVVTDAIPALKNNATFLSFAKIRAAYSQTAQVSIGAYSLTNTFNAGGGFPFGNVAGFSVNGRYNNPDILPEISTNKEVGLELGFLKNRISLSGAYYDTRTKNQTIPITISSATGFTNAIINSGIMSNKGYEVDLKLSPIVRTRSGFRWDLSANYSHNDNQVLFITDSLKEVLVGGNSYAIAGSAYPALKTTDWLRDPQGRIIVNKVTGYPSVNPQQVQFGTTNAPDKIGISSSLSFKGLTLGVVVDGRFGAVIDNGIGNNLDFTGVSAYSAQSGRQPFVIPNSVYETSPGSKVYVPNTNINTKDGNVAFWASTWNQAESNYVNSADFWKLREVSLGYTIPTKILNSYIKAVSFQVSARNLFTKKAKANVWSDPEFANSTGNDQGRTDINQLPPTKTISVSLNVTF